MNHHPPRTDRLAVALLALGIFLLFVRGPGLGDDFQYWWMPADLHLRGSSAWNVNSFHFLRWPVWGISWALQTLFGPGLAAYYGVPLFYVTCGSLLAFGFGLRIFQTRTAAWGCALAYLFHPLLDDVIYRPMPDLSEGVLIAAAVACWMSLAERETARARLPWALAAGLVCALLYANRLTGVFVFGVLAAVAGVLSWNNPRFPLRQAALWLGVTGLTALALISLECLLYLHLSGDFFHSITANLGARGRKGTASVFLPLMPFRFFSVLWKGGPLGPLFSVLAGIGAWRLWRTGGRRERAVVAWAVVLYLAYNCALQSLFPPRPLLRNAERFLCSLSIPMALLVWAAAQWLWSLWPEGLAWTRRRPVATGVLAALVLAVVSSRDFFELGFIPRLREVLHNTPPGTRIFTHNTMRFAAMLADAKAASRLQWSTRHSIFSRDPESERMAAEADEIWYCRKHLWLSARKFLEKSDTAETGNLATYLEKPDSAWVLRGVVAHEDSPEFVFYRKRPAGAPASLRTSLSALPPGGLAFPLRWSRGQSRHFECSVPVDPSWRGKPVRLEIDGKSNQVDAFDLRLTFLRGGKRIITHKLNPYLQHRRGLDFHAFDIPPGADTCRAVIRIDSETRSLEIEQLWLVADP